MEECQETAQWLRMAEGLDYSAKVLIRYCLAQAAQFAADKSREWVALAKKAEADRELDFVIVTSLLEEGDNVNKIAPSEQKREHLEDQLKRLDAFQVMAAEVASELRKQLECGLGSQKATARSI